MRETLDLLCLRDVVEAKEGGAAACPEGRRAARSVFAARVVIEVAALARGGLAQIMQISRAGFALVVRRVDLDDGKHQASPSGGSKRESNSWATAAGGGDVSSGLARALSIDRRRNVGR